jgi:hypothetical protein
MVKTHEGERQSKNDESSGIILRLVIDKKVS